MKKWNEQKMLEEKIEQIRASKKRYHEKYGNLTKRQREIADTDAVELLEQLQNGDLLAVEVVEAFIAKAVEVDMATNCVAEFLDGALERAKHLDSLPKQSRGPLHGLPISLKVHKTFDIPTKELLYL